MFLFVLGCEIAAEVYSAQTNLSYAVRSQSLAATCNVEVAKVNASATLKTINEGGKSQSEFQLIPHAV